MKKVKISFKKLTAKHLIFIQIVYNCFIKWLIGELGLPSTLNYVTDVITAALFVEIIFYEIKQTSKVRRTSIFYIIVIFFVYTLINWLMHLYSPIYYVWGLRNTFRFYVFFVACTMFLEKEDIPKIFNILYVVFIANIFMTSYQYFVLDKKRDYVAGFFAGSEIQGGNGPMVVLMCLVCIITMVEYIEKHNNFLKPAIAIVGALYISTIAELKAMYIMIIGVVILSSLFTRFSVKKLFIAIAFVSILPVAMGILYELYPDFEDFFNWESVVEYATGDSGYTGTDDINRFSAIQYCFDNFLETPTERIFGMGLGAADGSTNFKSVTTDFYEKNVDTHYSWFTVPMILLENGMIGLILFWSIFCIAFRDATRKRRRTRGTDRVIIIVAQLAPIFMIFFAFYNQTIRTEIIGYTCYALVSIPYIIYKEK